jgi:hypothetical protein
MLAFVAVWSTLAAFDAALLTSIKSGAVLKPPVLQLQACHIQPTFLGAFQDGVAQALAAL